MEDCRETRHPPVIPRMKGPPWKDLHSGRWPCWPHFVSACPKAARPRSVHWWCQYCRSPSHPSPRRAIVAGLCVLGCVWGLGLPQICQLGDFAHRGDRDCDRNRHRLGHGAYRVGQFCARADRRDRLYVFIVFLAKKPCQHTSNISRAHRRLILDNHRRLYRFCQPRRRAAMAGLGAAPETNQKMVFAGTSTFAFAMMNALKIVPYYALGQLQADNLRVTLILFIPAVIAVLVAYKLIRICPNGCFMPSSHGRCCLCRSN